MYQNRLFIKNIIQGSDTVYLIVGLGNPGKEYEHTRHNFGFIVIDQFAEKYQVSFQKKKFDGVYTSLFIGEEQVILLKPQRYMNLSGSVVKQFVDYFKIPLSHVLIVHDDLDLPFGHYRLRKNGSSGGHNGLKDIEKYLGTREYNRLKLGISKRQDMDTKDYVLGRFSEEELDQIHQMMDELLSILSDFVVMDMDRLMSRYNHRNCLKKEEL